MPQQQLKVMISSTVRDLPEHRKELVEACLRQDAFPLRMEDLPTSSDEAAAASLKMVEKADVYIGVFANRYGYVPKGNNPTEISVTEMEYNRAVERKVERLIFIMDKAHPITVDDVEIENAAKLKAFKDRVEAENIVKFFKSAVDLRAEAIHGLSKVRQPDLTKFHYVSDIPAPPEIFIAHPYTLLQTSTLIGRQPELKLLTDWITGKELEADRHKAASNSVRIMNIVAIGGLGKSALTWKWFNDIAPEEMKPLAGRMWWSFYESDASFENFVTRALAYVRRVDLNEVRQIRPPERETQLLAVLDRDPFLLVLDGLERILIAYARMDASRLDDSQVGKDRGFRKTADPRVGNFLRKLAQVRNSRILISSRLYPAELETDGGDPIPGSFRCDIAGLADEDAIELWRAFRISGSRDELLPVFISIGKHPLLIQALAGEVKRYHRAPGSFAKWRKANPQFDPSKYPKLQNAMAHVLEFAVGGLKEIALMVLRTITAFRMPTGYDTLAAVLVGKNKACANEPQLDAVLNELEDRGLVGWDKRANRYDLHPIVRGVIWSRMSDEAKRGIHETRKAHFESVTFLNQDRIASLDDLTAMIELYHTLVGLGHYEDAYHLFDGRLHFVMQFRLSCTRQQSELLEMLFPEGRDAAPYIEDKELQAAVLRDLAESYHRGGQPGWATELYYRSIAQTVLARDLVSNLEMLSNALYLSAFLRKSEATAFEALYGSRETGVIWDEAVTLFRIGIIMAARGISSVGQSALKRALKIFVHMRSSSREGGIKALMAECELWQGNYVGARPLADEAWELAHESHYERDFIRSARLQGMTSLGLADLLSADERLHHALTRARAIVYAEEELPALIGLSELRRRQGDLRSAREMLDDAWEAAERGPYPLIHADAFNVLARIERDAGNAAAAVEAATKAYRLAWCDGPPFAYHWGLKKAKEHLKEVGAPEPEMPPFDESKFEPMPDVEIDPDDEFHVGTASDA